MAALLDANPAIVQPGDVIWVSGGTTLVPKVYKPASAATSIDLKPGVSIQGGFAGFGATNPDARIPAIFVTVLSGDFDDDDITGDFTQNRDDNAAHVVLSPSGVTPPNPGGVHPPEDFANIRCQRRRRRC